MAGSIAAVSYSLAWQGLVSLRPQPGLFTEGPRLSAGVFAEETKVTGDYDRGPRGILGGKGGVQARDR